MKALYQIIKERFQLGPTSHMTAINNLPSIVKTGILPYDRMQGNFYHNISNEDVQQGRASKIIPCSGRKLHDLKQESFQIWKSFVSSFSVRRPLKKS